MTKRKNKALALVQGLPTSVVEEVVDVFHTKLQIPKADGESHVDFLARHINVLGVLSLDVQKSYLDFFSDMTVVTEQAAKAFGNALVGLFATYREVLDQHVKESEFEDVSPQLKAA